MRIEQKLSCIQYQMGCKMETIGDRRLGDRMRWLQDDEEICASECQNIFLSRGLYWSKHRQNRAQKDGMYKRHGGKIFCSLQNCRGTKDAVFMEDLVSRWGTQRSSSSETKFCPEHLTIPSPALRKQYYKSIRHTMSSILNPSSDAASNPVHPSLKSQPRAADQKVLPKFMLPPLWSIFI